MCASGMSEGCSAFDARVRLAPTAPKPRGVGEESLHLPQEGHVNQQEAVASHEERRDGSCGRRGAATNVHHRCGCLPARESLLTATGSNALTHS